MDVIREILLEAEKHEPASVEYHALEIEGRDPHLVYEHAVLLEEAGYIIASFSMGNPPQTVILRMTWAGYDLLANIREESVWKGVREQIGKVGGSVSIEVLKAVAVPVAASAVQLQAEIDARKVKIRLARLENPIASLHPDVDGLSVVVYDAVRANVGRSSRLDFPTHFYERYGKALAILEASDLISGTHTISQRFYGGFRPLPSYVLYMAALCEEPTRVASAIGEVEDAAMRTWLDGVEIATTLGVPWMLMAALFDVYESRGLGIRSRETGSVRYRRMI